MGDKFNKLKATAKDIFVTGPYGILRDAVSPKPRSAPSAATIRKVNRDRAATRREAKRLKLENDELKREATRRKLAAVASKAKAAARKVSKGASKVSATAAKIVKKVTAAARKSSAKRTKATAKATRKTARATAKATAVAARAKKLGLTPVIPPGTWGPSSITTKAGLKRAKAAAKAIRAAAAKAAATKAAAGTAAAATKAAAGTAANKKLLERVKALEALSKRATYIKGAKPGVSEIPRSQSAEDFIEGKAYTDKYGQKWAEGIAPVHDQRPSTHMERGLPPRRPAGKIKKPLPSFDDDDL